MKLRNCLACGRSNLFEVIDLGYQPLANNYGDKKTYPLVLNACEDCDHAQLSVSVSPKKLFSHYLYESGTSDTLKDWFWDFARNRVRGVVLDVASNDGTFLRACQQLGHEVLGIDPAKNLIPSDIPTVVDFFNKDSRLGMFDTITAFNVIAHTPDPLSIMVGIRENLMPNGSAWVMCSQGSQFTEGQFDTVYHEHHSYYCQNSMNALVQRAGMIITNVSLEPIHGGSLLFEIRHRPYIDFDRYSQDVEDVIAEAKNFYPKNRMVAYGAAAKGVVFLNATGLKPEFVVDEAEIKWGYNIPGTEIPIVSPEALLVEEDLTIIILAWNFYDEIVAKIRNLRPNNNDEFVRFYDN